MDTSARPALSAAINGGKRNPLVSRLTSKANGSSGIVITAATPGANHSALTQTAIDFAAKRKLSAATLERLGVASGITFFPELERKSEAIFFRYREGWKARAISDKAFVAGKGFKLDLWNIESVLAEKPKEVFICEGELDAAALVESGIPAQCVLSVPNGAAERHGEIERRPRGYDYVIRALKEGLSRVRKFIWCGDNDGPGLSLRADMAQVIGPARFYFVNWPEGCKDANDVLIHDGGDYLRGLVTEGYLPWPVQGLYRIGAIPETPPLPLWSTGMFGWDRSVHLAPRTLSVVTGHGGHGKTVAFVQIWYQVIRQYGLSAAIASFETRAKPHYRRILRTLHAGALEYKMSEDEIRNADQFINDHYLFLIHPDNRPTLEWFLDSAEVAVIRHGARIVQLDPWNRLEASRAKDETETEYIGRCLRELHTFANDMNCHVQIIAHPAKMDRQNKHMPPDLDDVSGSKHWSNMVDQGFTIHRPKLFDGDRRVTTANFYHRKARFDELGYPCKLPMNYNLATGRFDVGEAIGPVDSED